MKTKQALVPKLRFGEFESEWARLPISELIENGSIESHLDGNHGELYPRSEEFSDVGTPYISANDFVVGEIDFNTCKKLPPKRAEKFKKGISKNGDVLFAHNATVGPVTLLKTKLPYVILSTTATYFRCNTEKLHNSFLMFSLTANYFVRQYVRVMSQSTRNQVPITMQRKFVLQLPALPEQEKIAGFLTSVDDRIDQLKRKKSLLQDYKKGVMQKLFSQELRFKDDHGKTYPDWQVEKLGGVADGAKKWSFTGGPFGSNLKSEDYTDTGIRIIQLQNIGDGDFHNSYKIYTSEEKADELISCNIYPEDIILSKMGDPVARACIIPDYQKRYVMCSDGIRLAIDKSKFHTYFIYSSINYRTFRNSAARVATGSTRKRIGLTELRELPLEIPSHPEQTKIANFLSTLDQKIEQIDTQITQTQTFKKALLQQMFV